MFCTEGRRKGIEESGKKIKRKTEGYRQTQSEEKRMWGEIETIDDERPRVWRTYLSPDFSPDLCTPLYFFLKSVLDPPSKP